MIKSVAVLLGFVLVFHTSSGVPTPGNSPVPFTDLGQLVQNAAETYVEFFGYATDMYRQLFEKVLEMARSDAESDVELQSALKPFIDYVNKMHEMQDKSRQTLQMLFDECTQVADKYDRGVPVDASEADHKIAKYMNEANAIKTKFDILMKYVTSLQLFANNVRKYLGAIPEQERMKQKKLQQWYYNWQREHNWEKKNDLMLRFFEMLDDSKDDRTKLADKVVRNISVFLNVVVMARKDFYKEVIKDIENKFKEPNETVKYTLNIMKGFVNRVDKVNELKDMERMLEFTRLFFGSQDVEKRFKSTDLTDEEKEIAKMMAKHGEMDIEVRQILLTFGLGEELIKDVEEYLDTRQEEDKMKEDMMIKWFENVQDETDYYKRTQTLIGVLAVFGKI